MRELVWMVDGKTSEKWNHTSRLLAMMINCRPFVKSRQWVSATKFHPFAKQQQPRRRLTKAESRRRLDEAFGVSDA